MMRTIFSAAAAVILSLGAFGMTSNAHGGLALVATDSLVELSNDVQKISFAKGTDGKFRPMTYVWNGNGWATFFDAQRPLIEGSNFNLEPTSYNVLEDSAQRKLVQFHGSTSSPANVWDFGIDVRAGSPLIWFQIASHFQSNVSLPSPQPTVALWMNQSSAALTLDQGPPSPTGDVYNVPFNFGQPASYLWHQNKEAAILFDMTPMTWFASDGVYRFYDIQIKTILQNGQTGLGMVPRRHSGNTIHSGEMLVTFYLYSRWREGKPSKFEALDAMVQAHAPLYPANSDFPSNTLDGGDVSWKYFTQRALADFLVKNVTYGDLTASWADPPLGLVDVGSRMIVHPDRAVSTQAQAESAWSFATVNHHSTLR